MNQRDGELFKRVGILVNPAGGRMQKSGTVITEKLTALRCTDYREASSFDEMSEALRDFAASGVDLLVIVAGDGTVHAVLTLIFRDSVFSDIPVLSLIPAGTTNMTAMDFPIPDNPGKALHRLNEILTGRRKPVYTEKAVLCVENGDEAPLYGMFFGAGLIAEAVEFFGKSGKERKVTGEKASAFVFIRYVLKLLFVRRRDKAADDTYPADLKLTTNSGRQEDLQLIFASTLDRLLFGFRPYWGRQVLPVHVTTVSREASGLWRHLLPILFGRGNPASADGCFSENLSGFEIENSGNFIIDGELYTTDKNKGAVRLHAHDNITVVNLT